jgi:hypothetical protein
MYIPPAILLLQTKDATLRALQGARRNDPVRQAPPAAPARRSARTMGPSIAKVFDSVSRLRSRVTPT